jgi:hypothetical protein
MKNRIIMFGVLGNLIVFLIVWQFWNEKSEQNRCNLADKVCDETEKLIFRELFEDANYFKISVQIKDGRDLMITLTERSGTAMSHREMAKVQSAYHRIERLLPAIVSQAGALTKTQKLRIHIALNAPLSILKGARSVTGPAFIR